jgi:hypothetical protein
MQAFLTRPQVNSGTRPEMTLWRWENSETLDFPADCREPRKFFREEDLTNWERARQVSA